MGNYLVRHTMLLVLLVCSTASLLAADIVLPDMDVKDALLTKDGSMWAACASRGLTEGRRHDWLTHSPLNSTLPNSHPLRLETFANRLWASFFNGGLWKHSAQGWQEALPPQPLTSPRHCSDLLVWRNELWLAMGTRLGRVTAAGTFEEIHPPLPPGRGAVITCLAADQDRLFLGTNTYQIIGYDGSAWNILDFKGRLRGKRIRAMAVSPQGLWFGTFGGLYVYRDPELRELSPAGLSPPLVTSVVFANDRLWVGTWGSGVFHYANHRWHHGLTDLDTAGIFVNRLCQWHDRVLACTTRGVLVLHGDAVTTPTVTTVPAATRKAPRNQTAPTAQTAPAAP